MSDSLPAFSTWCLPSDSPTSQLSILWGHAPWHASLLLWLPALEPLSRIKKDVILGNQALQTAAIMLERPLQS